MTRSAGRPTSVRNRRWNCRYRSEATLGQVLGEHQGQVQKLEAISLQSVVLLNRPEGFAFQPLPREAQLSPAFSVNLADFDGDGLEDIFLSQNFFANQPEVPRFDAGRGLLLKGDGTGSFRAVPGQESGIFIYGEQRGAAIADFDGDGRIDLAVGQNSGPTKLFRNRGGRPGLRVHLRGPSGNPSGIGAQLRLHFGERLGAIREIHAGSGYLSQDSTVTVLSTPSSPSALWVRWPGGKVTTTELHGDFKTITVDYNGKVVP